MSDVLNSSSLFCGLFFFFRLYNDSCLELPNHLPWNKSQSKLINVVYQPLKVARAKEEKNI